MTALNLGTGWRDHAGRFRTLLWTSDLGWLLWDNGHDVHVIRRGLHDLDLLMAQLMGWEEMVDDPIGPDWVEEHVSWWPPTRPAIPEPDCPACQGEGWVADVTAEGLAVECGCSQERF